MMSTLRAQSISTILGCLTKPQRNRIGDDPRAISVRENRKIRSSGLLTR